ncbi:MAG: arginine--tRNA ligase [Oscillospiraceae bacterium]|nr:arginine--tRNA ligase [Oscillospiraceae bacterium]
MSKILFHVKKILRERIVAAVDFAVKSGKLQGDLAIDDFLIEIPAERSHGDLATNIALVSAKIFKAAPVKIAEIIGENLNLNDTLIERFEIAGGFINFFFSQDFYSAILVDVINLLDNYGKCNIGNGKRAIVEFVSANPTGPMHIGNARGGALGDCLAAILEAAGWDVWREFYVNDAGNQIEKFALSLEARYLQIFLGKEAVKLPEDCYQGEDINELAKEFACIHADQYLKCEPKTRREALVNFALPKNINKMKSDMEKYRINYDEWFQESVLHNGTDIKETVKILEDRGLTYESEGALWYKATQFGAEKDEVLIRKNGTPTYFTADIAYHRNKLEKRGFDLCIDVWGADHHGHVSRLKCALDAIGLDGSKLKIVLMQLVKLVRDGEVVRMSKRTGKAIGLSDLLEEVSADAARFLFNMREANSQMEFNLDLAVQQDAQNPVYYVQYAHARICGILQNLARDGIYLNDCGCENLALLNSPAERELIFHLARFTDEIVSAAKNYDPARVTKYVIQLATLFHKFYNSCRVKCQNVELMHSRIQLCRAVQIVIKNILKMFKINSPENM